jgi:hypothetical protein
VVQAVVVQAVAVQVVVVAEDVARRFAPEAPAAPGVFAVAEVSPAHQVHPPRPAAAGRVRARAWEASRSRVVRQCENC